jgi:hypothetical protein
MDALTVFSLIWLTVCLGFVGTHLHRIALDLEEWEETRVRQAVARYNDSIKERT